MNMPLGKLTSNSDFKKCSSIQALTYPKPKGKNQQTKKTTKPTNEKLQKMLRGIPITCPQQSAVGIKRRTKHKHLISKNLLLMGKR